MRHTKIGNVIGGLIGKVWIRPAAAAGMLLIANLTAAPMRVEASATATTIYSACDDLQLDALLAIKPLDNVPTDLDVLVLSPNNRLGYGVSLEGNRIWVLTIDEKTVEFSVPDWSHRLLNAQWVNDKLLYLETTFNPNAGAYWLMDVDALSMVTCGGWITYYETQAPNR